MRFILKFLSMVFLSLLIAWFYNMAMLSERLEAIEYALDSNVNVEQQKPENHE